MSWTKKSFDLLYKRAYFVLRVVLQKIFWILRLGQILRRVILLGPLNKVIIRYYQKYGKNEAIPIDDYPLFPKLDVEAVVNSLHEVGYSDGAILPGEYLRNILEFCERNRQITDFRHWNPHKECKTINRLAHNAKIIEVARKYLGAEPILWLTELKKSNPTSLVYRKPTQYDDNVFHNDLLDCKALTVFVYLSDVDLDSGPHVLIEGTHKNKSLKELTNIVISATGARKKYGKRIKTILGKKGTLFFEELSTYHKSASATRKKSRLILKIDYVLQRRVMPINPC